jgi:CelD/BcsL family acetyltransferase involved in cellulose biosynthesis
MMPALASVEVGFEIEVVTAEARVEEIRGEWDALVARAACRASEVYDWAIGGWRLMTAAQGRRLSLILARRCGRLVGMWPLSCTEERFWRVLRPLGPETVEFSDMLVETGDDEDAVGRALWRAAAGLGDVAILPHVREGCVLGRIVAQLGGLATRDVMPTRWIEFAGSDRFSSFLADVSPENRVTERRMRRGLHRLGRLELVELDDPDERAAAVDRILALKLAWLLDPALNHQWQDTTWIQTDGYRALLLQLARLDRADAPLRVHELRLDGAMIAAGFCLVTPAWTQFNLTYYDPAFRRKSPGIVLLLDLIRVAAEAGGNFDFSIGDRDYKAIWSNRSCDAATYHVVLRSRGAALVAAEWLRLARLRGRSRYRQLRAWGIERGAKPVLARLGAKRRHSSDT